MMVMVLQSRFCKVRIRLNFWETIRLSHERIPHLVLSCGALALGIQSFMCIYIYIFIYLFIYLFIHLFICVYTYTHMLIHTIYFYITG